MTDGRFQVAQATGPDIETEALVFDGDFSVRYDLNRTTGVIARADHALEGHPISGRLLICRGVQGGVAADWALLAMAQRGVCCAGLVFKAINPVMVQGALVAGVAVAAGLDPEAFDQIRSGDRVRLEPSSHSILLLGHDT